MIQRNGSLSFSRSRLRTERGTTLVEFAFVFVVLATMMLGVVDFSRALYTYHFLSNMARTATRWTAVNGYNCADDTSSTDTGGSCNGTDGMHNGPVGPSNAGDVQTYVRDHAPLGIDPNKITVTATWLAPLGSPPICTQEITGYSGSPFPNYPGCTVEVQVSYAFNFLYPLVHTGTINLSSTSEMVIAH